MKKIVAVFTLLFLSALHGWAQEKLYLKNQREPIPCKVLEINVTEIKYQPSDADGLVVGVGKNEVEKIVFKSGRAQYFTDPLQDFNHYKGQKRWVAKAGILSPAFGFTDLYLEKSLKPGKSVEFQANIIGLGKNLTFNSVYSGQNFSVNQRGASVGVGMKVLRLPDFEISNRKLMHILQGSYIKPAINIGYYQRNFLIGDQWGSGYKTVRKPVVTSNVSVSFGKQWILDNTFSLEIYGSLGLSVDNFRTQQKNINRDVSNGNGFLQDETIPYTNFGYTRFGRGDAGLSIGTGLKLGYLFNWKKTKEVGGVDKNRARLNK